MLCTVYKPASLLVGFVEEMRFVAMKLHTKDQAPKEGGKEAAPQPFQKVNLHIHELLHRLCCKVESVLSLASTLIPAATLLQWEPTREGYLRFLVESKLVYDALEQIVQQAPVPECESSYHQGHFTLQCAAWTCQHICGQANSRSVTQKTPYACNA